MIDGRRARGQHFDHDNRVDEKKRIIRWLRPTNDQAIRRIGGSFVDFHSSAAAKDLAIAASAARSEPYRDERLSFCPNVVGALWRDALGQATMKLPTSLLALRPYEELVDVICFSAEDIAAPSGRWARAA
jgi:hypothetical protein